MVNKDSSGETKVKGVDFSEKQRRDIDRAMSQGARQAGTASLPSEVNLTGGHGEVVRNDTAIGSGDAVLYLPPAAEAARQAQTAEHPTVQQLDPVQAMMSKQLAGALAAQQTQRPATAIKLGNFQRSMPSSVTEVPHRLHESQNDLAKQLWKIFCGKDRRILSQLAAKSGHPSEPFVWLNQAIFAMLDLESWLPATNGSTKPFNKSDRSPSESFYRGLIAWSGLDNARLLLQTCERERIDTLECLKQMYAELEARRSNLVDAAAKYQTQYEWSGEDDEDEGQE